MKKIRFYIAIFLAKLVYLFLKITKLSSGTAIIGLITLKICPDFLTYVNNYIKTAKINVTGTNGKTTTCALISHILKHNSKTVIHNSSGANMLNGIVNTLAIGLSPHNKFDYSLIETDEAFLSKVYSKMQSDYLVVTNLFEDQVDRFANPEITKSLIQEAINKQQCLKLILNADDPCSSGLTSSENTIFYGINNVYDENNNNIKFDSSINYKCICGQDYKYDKRFYSQLGHFHCNCSIKRPEPKYNANVTLYKDKLKLELNNEIFEAPLTGLYNAYNVLGAIALLKELNIINIQIALDSFKVASGRNEKRILNNKEVTINLIKNPAGTNEVLQSIDLNSKILIAINNNSADGKDVSWINSVNFESLKNSKEEIVVSGLKAKEVAQRLASAGVENIKIIEQIKDAVIYVGTTANNKITILPSYTVLLKIDKIKELKKCY